MERIEKGQGCSWRGCIILDGWSPRHQNSMHHAKSRWKTLEGPYQANSWSSHNIHSFNGLEVWGQARLSAD